MATCKYCGYSTVGRSRVCNACLNEWSDMRRSIWNFCIKKYGNLNQETHNSFKKEMKRFEKVWKKNRSEFQNLLSIEELDFKINTIIANDK